MKSLLKNAREQKGLKTRELAQMAEIDQALISKFESGTRKPTRDQIIKLAQLLEIDYETLMIAWLKEKILFEIGDEEFALKALLLAEQEIQNNSKKNNSVLLSSVQIVLDEIEILKNKIQSLNHFELRQISKTLELNFVFNSIQLNESPLTFEETKSIINDGLTIAGKSIQNHLEAINFQEATLFIKDLNQKKIHVNEKDFLALHSLIFKGIEVEHLGKYKDDSLVAREMSLFFNWYESNKNNLHPIILASEANLKILEISPFAKGNLQMANLILNWILLQNNYTYASIEINNIKEYFSALEESQIKNDKSVFVNYILRIEKENLKQALDLVQK
ncbi:helix-turn-helix domain-containing protein [Flavobacterium daemonense]|uniref:helix-turn-helix domain-containing protein n=1 Tax=Flavobacterium daemonense TaxID=1393049 RepID=UPI0011870AF6|nr:helix-turn-helix domain-containing protein [Flavobacterium daemonense]KAF2331358.1 helix-turn-helix domain-containing protein [Flavobacterium daemonense]